MQKQTDEGGRPHYVILGRRLYPRDILFFGLIALVITAITVAEYVL